MISFRKKVAEMKELSEKLSQKKIDSDEYCTPPEIIKCARRVAGGNLLDPAANEHSYGVGFAKWWTIEDNSLDKDWTLYDKIWLNPPYSRGKIKLFIAKYGEWCTDIKELSTDYHGFVLVNSATDTDWYHYLLHISDAILFFRGRIRFFLNGVRQGSGRNASTLFYTGKNIHDFNRIFIKKFGSAH